MSGDDPPLLDVRNLTKHYPLTEGLLRREVGRVRAVDGVSFTVDRGETVGLVGESGCGKSTAATAMLRLEEPTGGEVLFDGEDILAYDKERLKRFRRRAQMIFQDPESSFDPRMSIGESIAEPLRIHGLRDRERRRDIARDLLERVGLGEDDLGRYPHELSGGQKQRVALARALVVNPDLLVADEPVSALDVSIQADILSLMEELQAEFGLGVLFISHDMGVIREICDRVAVMYLGEIVEVASAEALFEDPQHPYTRALLSSVPTADPRRRGGGIELTGDVPDPSNPPAGCRFHTRCPEVIQPEGYDLDQSAWRGVMDLRGRLEGEGVDPATVREFAATEYGVEEAEVTGEMLREQVRAEFDIPGTLGDPDAEDVLSEALDHIAEGAQREATALLAREFPTVCESETVGLVDTEAGHPSACHRHERGLPPAVTGRADD